MSRNIGDLTGQTLGTCKLERLIGQGGMGAVYLARQLRPARNVAVKILQPHVAPSSQIYQEFLSRFRREADVIARLEHPNIMPIYEYGELDGLAFLVMPYLAGGSLRDVLFKQGALSLTATAHYIDQAASALDYAHTQGIIHRDLKPANFLLHADGRLVMADFGIARLMEEHPSGATLTGTGALIGTPEYMAPEMVQGNHPIDSRADIYELGVVLFQMLSGHVPFTGNTPYAIILKHVQETLPLLHQKQPDIPPRVDAVIQKATAKQRDARYSTANALAQDLHAAIAASAQHTTLPPSGPVIPTVAAYPSYTDRGATQLNTPLQQKPIYTIAPSTAGQSAREGYKIQTKSGQTPLYLPTRPRSARMRPWSLVLGIVLVIALVFGGVFVGIRISKNRQINIPLLTTSTVPTGAQIYISTTPGPGCDTGGGRWINFDSVQVSCQGSQTHLKNTMRSTLLQGIFLTTIPRRIFPANYVVQVQMQADQQSLGDFGIYFRNQPDNQLGVYSLLVHPNGRWSAYIYNDTTGTSTEIARGVLGNARAPINLAVVVNGQQFSFYANGRMLGSVTDQSYATGTVGIALDRGSSIVASNFTLSALAP